MLTLADQDELGRLVAGQVVVQSPQVLRQAFVAVSIGPSVLPGETGQGRGVDETSAHGAQGCAGGGRRIVVRSLEPVLP